MSKYDPKKRKARKKKKQPEAKARARKRSTPTRKRPSVAARRGKRALQSRPRSKKPVRKTRKVRATRPEARKPAKGHKKARPKTPPGRKKSKPSARTLAKRLAEAKREVAEQKRKAEAQKRKTQKLKRKLQRQINVALKADREAREEQLARRRRAARRIAPAEPRLPWLRPVSGEEMLERARRSHWHFRVVDEVRAVRNPQGGFIVVGRGWHQGGRVAVRLYEIVDEQGRSYLYWTWRRKLAKYDPEDHHELYPDSEESTAQYFSAWENSL